MNPLKMKRYKELRHQLQVYAHQYYCLNNPLVDDYEYDLLFDKVGDWEKELRIKNGITDRVGTGVCKELHETVDKTNKK